MGKNNRLMEENIIDEEEVDEEDFHEDENQAQEGVIAVNLEKDLSDVSYEDFSKVQEISEEELIEDAKEEETAENISSTKVTKTTKTEKEDLGESMYMEDENVFISILNFFWTWFRRLGIVIAVVLSAYYVVHGMFKDLLLYILLLVAAYFFGYGFMFVLTHFTDNQ